MVIMQNLDKNTEIKSLTQLTYVSKQFKNITQTQNCFCESNRYSTDKENITCSQASLPSRQSHLIQLDIISLLRQI